MAQNLLKKAETKSLQVLLLFDESDIEDHEDCSLGSTALDTVLFLGDEQEEAKGKQPEDLDLLCLETACADVLHTFWCEIKTRAEDFGVPEMALRAMAESTFLSELDEALGFIEEERKPLTRAKYLRVLMRAELRQAERAENATHPYRVPKEKWDELKRKARGGERLH